jgi:hypothetical protein
MATARTEKLSSMLVRCLSAIFLFSAWPLLNFIDKNRLQLDGSGVQLVLLTLFLTALVACFLFYLAHRLTGRKRPAACAVAVIAALLLFYNYHLVFDGLVRLFAVLGINRGENFAYAFLALGIPVAAVVFANQKSLLDILLVFGLVVTAIPALGSSYFFLSRALIIAPQQEASDRPVVDSLPLQDTPDIYHIILDAYAREDMLERSVDWDNSGFLEEMRRRGFFIADRAYANYPTTFVSIASVFEMKYPITEATEPFTSRSSFYRAIRGDNPAVNYLKHQGYRFALLGSGSWDGSKCSGYEDLCLSSNNAVQNAILYLTPLRRFSGNQRTAVGDLLSQLDTLQDSDTPTYTFAHLLIPHPPRSFSTSCGRIRNNAGLPVTDFWGDLQGYKNDVRCLNTELTGLIDEILRRDPRAVILMHGDHGTAFSVDWTPPIDKWPRQQLDERLAIFLGVRLPSRCSQYLYKELSPVNIYPLLFACLQGVQPSLNEDRSYVTPKDDHPQFGIGHPYEMHEAAGRE